MCHFYLLISFILIFLACDILEKKKVSPTGSGFSGVKSVPVSISRKGELCTIISIFLVVLFPRMKGCHSVYSCTHACITRAIFV